MNWDEWPKCAVPACQNKCCLRLRSKYCWPHTPGSPDEARANLLETDPADALRQQAETYEAIAKSVPKGCAAWLAATTTAHATRDAIAYYERERLKRPISSPNPPESPIN
jgi:hypothetical protein